MNAYKVESSDPTYNAQRNLMGRTHYVDPDTLRFHKSRILSTHIFDDGRLFALVESCAADMNNTRRVFRYVIFDIFGTVIARPKLKESFSNRRVAEKAMFKTVDGLNSKEITDAAIRRAELCFAGELADMREKLLKDEVEKSIVY